jgi:phosphoadenosine phosphosulfate reductase
MTTFNIDELNQRFESASATDILMWATKTFGSKALLTSSFGGDSAALLHMAAQIDPKIRVVLLNTGFLFQDTLAHAEAIIKRLQLNYLEIKATPEEIEQVRRALNSPDNKKGECCDVVKVRLMQEALKDSECWIAGLQRSESRSRKDIKVIESIGEGMLKVHPIASWTSKDVYDYMKKFDLPFHPLWHKGYKSIGCEPCTSLPLSSEDERSGRWAGTDKTECGIHTFTKGQKS